MIVRISVLIGIILFNAFAWCEPDTIIIKPSEIFEGLPPATSTSSPQSKPESISPPTSDTQPSTPLKETFVLDNKALEEYLKSHPEPYVASQKPTPFPDIEKLRDQIHATPIPTPASDIISFSIPITAEKMNDKWNQLEADFVIDYQMKKLYSSLSLKAMEDNSENVNVLKNSPSIESFPVKKGRYEIKGTFWLPHAPDLEIKAAMGIVIVNNRMRYTIMLDRNMEQNILHEIGLRNADKLKVLEDKSHSVINRPKDL